MIRTKTEYQVAKERLAEEKEVLKKQRAELRKSDLTATEVKRAMEPLLCFHQQLKEEVESYDRLCRGEFRELTNFEGVGQSLIALRISQGMTQRELAERLGVHETTVSRDERNDYHGITVDRATRILNALGGTMRTTVEGPKNKHPPTPDLQKSS